MAADVRLSEPTLNWTRAVAGTELGKNINHLFLGNIYHKKDMHGRLSLGRSKF